MAYGVTIPCYDLVVMVGGEEHRPREGQTITIRPSLPLGISRQRDEFRRDLLALPDDVTADRIDAIYEQIHSILSVVILNWTWVGPDGEVLPTPAEDPTVIAREMTLEDYVWIMGRYEQIQADDEEKKDDA